MSYLFRDYYSGLVNSLGVGIDSAGEPVETFKFYRVLYEIEEVSSSVYRAITF